MTTVDPVSSKNPATSVPTLHKKTFNEFHFNVLNCFNLDEFKKFTNFPQLLKETIKQTLGSAPDRFSFEDRIRHHFRRSISNEEKWQRGLFNDLKLNEEFYCSDAAKRIFKESYGVRECVVRVMRLPSESRNSADLRGRLQETRQLKSSSANSNRNTTLGANPPKTTDPLQIPVIDQQERLQEPLLKVSTPATKPRVGPKSVMLNQKQLQLPLMELSDKSTEPVVQTSANDVSAVSKPKVGPKSRTRQLKSSSADSNRNTTLGANPPKTTDPLQIPVIDQQERLQEPSLKVSTPATKPRVGPKSVILNQKELQLPLMELSDKSTEPVVQTSSNVVSAVSKPKVGPKSRTRQLKSSSADSNRNRIPVIDQQERLQEPSPIVSSTTIKPRVGPKSAIPNRQLSLKQLSAKSTHTGQSIEPPLANPNVSASSKSPAQFSSNVVDENAVAKIDRTMSHMSYPNIIDPPKRRVKYQRKHVQLESHDSYTSPAKYVERTPMLLSVVGFDEEAIVLSTEPAQTSSKRMPVISNVSLVPPKPSRDETIQRQPDHRSHSSRRRVSKQVAEQLPVAEAINKKPKSQLGLVQLTQDLLQDLMDTNPILTLKRLQEPSLNFSTPATKPRVGPKSVMRNRKQLQLPLKELSDKTVARSPSSKPVVKSNVVSAMPKPKVGPKSRTRQLKSSSAEPRKSARIPKQKKFAEFINDLELKQLRKKAKNVPARKSKIESEAQVKSPALLEPTIEFVNLNVAAPSSKSPPVEKTWLQPSQIIAKSTGIMDTSEIPSQSCHVQQTQANSSLDSFELSNNINRSIERAKQHSKKYVAESDRNHQSVKQFWEHFFRSEFASETQLIATPDNVELKVQSQEILQPNQVHADIAEEAHMKPHPFRCAKHSDVQLETKSKVELVEYDNNEMYSSDVRIIEPLPEEIIEIPGDDTQQLFDQLQVDRSDSEELVLPTVISLPTRKTMSSVASCSKGFLTLLPVIASKKRNYQPSDFVVEPVQNHPPSDLLAFSHQQHLTPPSIEDHQIEECTMTESQHQRDVLLNEENSIFWPPQSEHCAFNTAKTTDPKSDVIPIDRTSQPLALKRISQGAPDQQPNKRRRFDEAIERELNWKMIDVRKISFEPLGNYAFHATL